MRSERVSPRVRKFLGQRLRTLRTQQGWSQRALGREAGLSGKFIGEVERGEKSISVDSLWGVSRALGIPLRMLTDAPADRSPVPSQDAERLLALLVQHRAPRDLRRAHRVLRSIFRRTQVR
jgi:transcriptional regulator with XRE-family HTH domain